MSSTYRQVEESRAASRVGSRAGSPGPGQGQNQGGRGGGRLRLVEERIEMAQESAGRISDVNEQVFRELKRRGNERAEKLGTVWLDGVSVSSSGGLSQLVQQRLREGCFRNRLRIVRRRHRPCQSPPSSCHTRFGPVPSHATTSTRRPVMSQLVAYGSALDLQWTPFGSGFPVARSSFDGGYKIALREIGDSLWTCSLVRLRGTRRVTGRRILAGKADGSAGGVTR
jgi:hypothetical protein